MILSQSWGSLMLQFLHLISLSCMKLMSVPENSPIRRQHFDVTDAELELSRPLDTAASRVNKGKNPILFSVCGRDLSPRLSEQNRANILPSESLSSLCSKADLCFWVLRPRLWSQAAGARVGGGGRDALRDRIGQGFPRSPFHAPGTRSRPVGGGFSPTLRGFLYRTLKYSKELSCPACQ